jgi:protocatechuate 3,4-dioxygenase beta subunit
MDGITRRELCQGALGALVVAGACGGEGTGTPDGNQPTLCQVYRRQTEGPFYIDDDLLRSDITEGKPGARLALAMTIVRAADCAPVVGAAVDIWQCDVDGRYSGYPNQLGGVDTTGQTFLRGTQVTDATGLAQFVTIYPGWYPGRTTHIHFKVRETGSEATSQLYFPESTTQQVYTQAPYATRGQKDTTNSADGVVAGVLPPLLVVASDGAGGFTASLQISVT